MARRFPISSGTAEWYLSGSGRFCPGGGSENAFDKKRCRDFFREAAETYCYFPVYLFLLAFFQGWKSDEGVRRSEERRVGKECRL